MSNDFWSTLNKKKKEELLKSTQTKASSSQAKPSSSTSKSEDLKTSDFWSVLNEDRKQELMSSGRTFMPNDDDIAPVVSSSSERASFFTKGGLSDGYDKWDVSKTVAGTVGDVLLTAAQGVGNMAEGLVDLGAYGVAGVSNILGADDFAKKAKDFAKKNHVDEVVEETQDLMGLNDYSVLGKYPRMVGNGVGQILGTVATAGLGKVGSLGKIGSTILTSGVIGASGMGSGMSEAYSMGATDGQATAYGASVGATEVISEMIFGGLGKGFNSLGLSKGLTSIDDVVAKKLSNTAAKFITSEAGQKVVGNALEYTVKSGAEGLEEVISGFGSAIAKDAYLMNGEDEKAFLEILEDENLLEQFVIGSIVSGFAQGGDVINATKNGRDFVSGLSKNEQTVVDKVYEQRLAEESKNRTLTNRDKNKLYERVVEEMKRGYVTTDEIESILGGETYKGYKDLTDKKTSLEGRKTAIENEIKSLVKTPESQFTVEQREKLTSLREEAKGIKEALQNLGIKTAKNKLFNEVNKLTAKDTYLRESYNDLIRQTQDLQIDENQYNGTKFADAAKKTIANARKAEASNSNRVRDFVEFSAKYSSVSGTVVDFKDENQIRQILENQLKAEITTLQKSTTEEDKTKLAEIQDMLKQVQEGEIHVNGVKTKDGVAINLKSPNYLNVVLGHEVTHFLEGKNAYEPLQKAIFKFAKTKGDYEGRRKVLDVLYKNVKGTTVDYELTADLVGDYLFTEYDFIKSLSTENRNVFQYVFDQIKYVYKLATAGSKEARELEKVMHQFEKVLRESTETSQSIEHNETATQFSLRTKPAPKKTQEVYKLMRLKDGEIYPLFIDSTEPLKVGEWYDADSPNLDFLKEMPSGVFLVDANNGTYQSYDEYLQESGERKTKYPSKNAIEKATAEGKRWVFIEDTAKAQKRFDGETRKYWNIGINGSGSVSTFSMRPGYHAGSLPTMRQIGKGANRDLRDDSFVWTVGEVPADIDYQAEAEQNPDKDIPTHIPEDGYYLKATNADKAKSQADRVGWYVAGSYKINRIISDSEARQVIDNWNAEHPDTPVEYDYDRESGMDFDADQMKLVPKSDTKFSISKDSRGNNLTPKQQEFFKDSKVVDDNGNLKVMYHTTGNDFTVFDKARKGETTEADNAYMGFFFAESEDYMQNFPEFKGQKTDAYYLDMKNPIDMTNISKEAFLDVIEATGGDVDEAIDIYDEAVDEGTSLTFRRLLTEMIGDYSYSEFYQALEPNFDTLIEKGYDGVINFMDERLGEKEYIVFDSNQAKLTTNSNPTADPDVRYSLSSMANKFFGDEKMTSFEFKKVNYKETDGYKNYVDECINNMRQTRTDFDEAVARQEIEKQIDGIVRVALAAKKAGYDIYDDATKRSKTDSKNRLLFSSLEPNSDYFTSNDISTICDKRKNFAEIYDEIVKTEEAKGVPQGKRFFDNVDNYFVLHKIMADKGLTQPCRQCYVESMRKNLAPMANAFLKLVNETDVNNKANDQLYQPSGKHKGELKSNNAELRKRVLEVFEEHPEYDMSVGDLTVETLTTEDGLAHLKIRAPLIYEAFNSFYGQSKPKMPKSATPFRFGELTALLTDEKGKIKPSLVEKINSTGGFRLQSYSDFQIQNFTDVLQVIFEAGTLGLNGHAYTKVPAFLEATEGTNLKRNISIFMYKDGNEWKLDKNDSFPYELEEIYKIVNDDKSGNTGIIAVSQNKDMSCWIMANDFIAYGIPFHKSGMKMGTVRDTDVKTDDGRIIKGYSGTIDHTKQQTEVWAKATEDHKALTKVKKGINIYSKEVGWDFENKGNLSKNELIEKNVKAYIDACERAGYLPKFRDYVMNNGAVLNDVLKYSKELGFMPQDATIADISFEYKGYTIPYGYYKFLGDFNMFTPDGKASPQETLSLNNYDFDKAEKFFADAEGLRRNEILQQFANGEERQKYRDSDLNAEELTKIVNQKRKEVAESIVAPVKQMSLSREGEKRTPGGSYRFEGKDFRVKSNQDIAPVAEGVAKNATTTNVPVAKDTTFDAPMLENIPVLPDEELEQGTIAAIRPKPEKQPSMKRVNNAESKEHIAQVLTEEPKVEKKKKGIISTAIRNFVDKGAVFENLSLKTKNRALQDTYKAMGRSETKAQYFMENGTEGVKPLNNIIAEVEQTGKTKEFYDYLYHKHNVDRMSLESRERPNLERLTGKMKELKLLHLQENQLRAIASEKITHKTTPERTELVKTVREYLKSKDVKNKPVFDYSVTAEMSQETAKQYEVKNPEFKEYAQDVYDYMNHLRKMMVYNGVISLETAELWAKTYPYYVPIRRVDNNGLAVDVPLDTRRTGINAPIKRATGGNSDILPLFNTMAQRTMQTFKAIDKNRFGIELKDTLGGVTESTTTSLDEVIESIDAHESLLQEGKNGKNPTFTVFEGGERVTFDITDEMYDALKPTSEGLSYTNKALNTASNLHRGVLTEYSVPFMVTNAIKDAQDVLINSQHATKTYAKFPTAINELRKHGKWYTEYMENGGGDNTYFDKQTNTFNKEKSQLRKIIGFPFDKISDVNNFIEKVPRLAEYIASRESGASIDAAMLDAARVTTDFSAGGDVTKFLNRNGATFLNASVQGFAQQVRNVREAKMNGLKGWLGLATKITLAGLPAMLLNKLLWDDDEEYEELSDYVKENYYVVAKYGDGKFVRIPKGRTLAVIQNGFEQISNTLTGDDEADFGRFFELFLSNLAPNNPLDNNIIAPIKQVAENKTWYGEDLVPTRLQDLPAAEQYDESSDAISKWLGEKTNTSPYKINYLLNQYSGGIGDIFLPMMTPEAESGDNSLLGNFVAPLKDKFTTDSVMNNQNVSDFYDTVDVLTKNAKSSYATDEDILKNKYINSVNTELGDLYKAKREIQNSNLSDSVKYAQVRSIQDQINNLAKNALNSYEKVNIQGGYATVGDKHYRLDDGVWTKISDKQLERQQEVTNELGISPSEYWSKTDISYFPNSDGEYEYAYDNPDKYAISKIVGGYDTYKTYSKELYNIKSDKDENGKSISGSRKEKVLNYINNLDADYETKIILWKSEYPSDDTYNMEIINYINNRGDLTYEERVAIFQELGFTVSDGSVYWD